jgi:Fe-S-cluster containining protein
MEPSPFQPISPEAQFRFGCHPQVSCFNQCCRDLNQALTPYDVMRLSRGLQISSQEFIQRYATIYSGPATGLPVVQLRFADQPDRTCPFVSPAGCRVYNHRPGSCRLYPLARAVQRSKRDGRLTVHYALLKEAHCCGFQEGQTQRVDRWIADQGLADYLKMNDMLMELIALKNQLRPGPLSSELDGLARLALYDVELLKDKAARGSIPDADVPQSDPLPASDDDAGWLIWGQKWIRRVLFGEHPGDA